jgi:ribosomal 50S subunit-recycling heat shock protein
MSEEKTSQVNKKKRTRKRKKHHVVLPYIATPIIFVLISMVFVLPIMLGMMNTAVSVVHTAQKTLTLDFNDVDIVQEQASEPLNLSLCQSIGTITCDTAGLNTKVYYGINRVALRNGVGLSTSACLFGNDGNVKVAGYSSTAFKALYNVKVGDVINVHTEWGEYDYEVTDVITSDKSNAPDGNYLVMSTSAEKSAFSYYDNEKLYVIAKEIKEVQ